MTSAVPIKADQHTGTSVPRRMGTAGSANWSAMLDAAERILCEEGYAALTSRRVAEVAGFKQRLVYYYFQSMDDLVTMMFRRMVERETERLTAISISARPIRGFWQYARESRDTRLSAEFVTLAHRNAAFKKEVADFITWSRRMQIDALEKAMAGRADGPAAAMIVLATNLALSLNREAALGIDLGHDEAEALISTYLDVIEP